MQADKQQYPLLGLKLGEVFRSMTAEMLRSTRTLPLQHYMSSSVCGMEAMREAGLCSQRVSDGRRQFNHLWHFWPSALLTPTVTIPTPSISVQLL